MLYHKLLVASTRAFVCRLYQQRRDEPLHRCSQTLRNRRNSQHKLAMLSINVLRWLSKVASLNLVYPHSSTSLYDHAPLSSPHFSYCILKVVVFLANSDPKRAPYISGKPNLGSVVGACLPSILHHWLSNGGPLMVSSGIRSTMKQIGDDPCWCYFLPLAYLTPQDSTEWSHARGHDRAGFKSADLGHRLKDRIQITSTSQSSFRRPAPARDGARAYCYNPT